MNKVLREQSSCFNYSISSPSPKHSVLLEAQGCVGNRAIFMDYNYKTKANCTFRANRQQVLWLQLVIFCFSLPDFCFCFANVNKPLSEYAKYKQLQHSYPAVYMFCNFYFMKKKDLGTFSSPLLLSQGQVCILRRLVDAKCSFPSR